MYGQQYPGGDGQREAAIETGAARPARLILDDAHASIGRVEDAWRRMPAEAWGRLTAARVGTRPAWMSVWARWRETEIHHVDLEVGYTCRQWPAEFVAVLLPRVLPTLWARLADPVTVRAEATDLELPASAAAGAAEDLVIVRGPAEALLGWLLGRPAAPGSLTITSAGKPSSLPRLRPWA